MKPLVYKILLISTILSGHTTSACAPQQKFQSQSRWQIPRPTSDPYFQRPQSLSLFGSTQTQSPNYLKILSGLSSLSSTASGSRNLFGSSSSATSSPNRNFIPNFFKPQRLTNAPTPTVGIPPTTPSITFRAQPRNPTCPATTPVQNKILVVGFYQRTFGDKNLQNLEQYLLPTYIQHNPGVPDGIDGFISLFTTGALKGQPRTKVDFKRVSAEDNLVWLHTRLPLGTRNYSIVDIFRIECGKIAEHWDVLQEITPSILRNSKNTHPFF